MEKDFRFTRQIFAVAGKYLVSDGGEYFGGPPSPEPSTKAPVAWPIKFVGHRGNKGEGALSRRPYIVIGDVA